MKNKIQLRLLYMVIELAFFAIIYKILGFEWAVLFGIASISANIEVDFKQLNKKL